MREQKQKFWVTTMVIDTSAVLAILNLESEAEAFSKTKVYYNDEYRSQTPILMPRQTVKLLDYRQEKASDAIVPKPAVLSSAGWESIHLEIHQQPTFETVEHQHTMHILAYGVSTSLGESTSPGERWLDGKFQTERRSQGDIAIIPAGIAHRCNWNTSAEFAILALEPALLQQVGQGLVECDRIELMPRFMSKQDALIQGIFTTLRQELETGGIGSYLLIDSLKMALAIHLLRNYCTTKPKPSCYSDGLSPKLTLVTDYINEHLHQDLRLGEIAAIAQMSPYHFSHLFKQKLGITPHQYILHRRINKAKSLLQTTELSIAEIAVGTGFCDQSHLTRYFKRTLGVTPKQFRQS